MKKTIIGIVIGIIISTTTVYAASILSSSVVYDNSTSNGSSKTVQGALDELYNKVKYGNATAEDILEGKTALVQGEEITGTLVSVDNKPDFYIKKFGLKYPGSDISGPFSELQLDTTKYTLLSIKNVLISNTNSGYCRIIAGTEDFRYYSSTSNLEIDVSNYDLAYLYCYANKFTSSSLCEFDDIYLK